MAVSLVVVLLAGEFTWDILLTLGDVVAAALLAVGVGFVAGAVVHWLPALRRAMEPLLASYYAVPTFMLYPVFIILFGVGSGAIIAISALLAVVAMVTATLTALDRVPAVLRRTARILRLGPVATAWRVVLPAAMPYLFTGVKLAVAYAFIGVIASEFILSGAGIGYAIAYAYNNFNNQTMYALMLLVVIIVTVVNGGLNAVDRRLQARLRG
jgi:NitT/TauT family transport system permease protein